MIFTNTSINFLYIRFYFLLLIIYILEEEQILVDLLKNPKTKNKAFDTLVEVYKKRLYWHIRKIVINHDDADDVLQNTFIKIYKNIESFKGESKLYSWLYRIATNEAISFINKNASKKNIPIDDYQKEMSKNLNDDNYFEGSEIQLILQQAIAQLPQKQQLVFNMRYFDEMKYEDMAEILNTSVGALKASYHHAVKKIESYVKQY